MFEIITLEELLKRLDNYSHKELHVHHTWEPNKEDFNGSNGIALQNGMRNYHVNTLGWADIGQHVTLLPDGKFVTGRDFGQTPASITGYNAGAFACEMLGNFDTGHDVLEGSQKASILSLARYFNDKGRYIRFHRENSSKTCPGSGINKEIFMFEVKSFNGMVSKVVTAAPATPAASMLLSVDDIVLRLQRALNRLWVTDDNMQTIVEDGIMGAKTKQAIMKFQSAMKLSVDGVAGPNTWIVLNTILSKPLCKYEKYDRTATRYVQWRFNMIADGIFGINTIGRVKSYQIDMGLTPDGIVGPGTWGKLIG